MERKPMISNDILFPQMATMTDYGLGERIQSTKMFNYSRITYSIAYLFRMQVYS